MLAPISCSLPRYCSPISFSNTARSMSSSTDKRADVDDVLEQLALARVGVFAVASRSAGMPITVRSSRNFDAAAARAGRVER